MIALALLPSVLAAATEIHISPGGDDANPGTLAEPVATPERAQTLVRDLITAGLSDAVAVIFADGTYHLDAPLELRPEDSGTAAFPITWKAADGARVILSGGKPITGTWTDAGDGTWHIELSGIGLGTTDWNFRQLFVNGSRATRARFPNASQANPFLYATGGGMDHVIIDPVLVRSSWAAAADAQINIVPRSRFFNQWNTVTAVDNTAGRIDIADSERHRTIDSGSWFWIEGVREELDEPGEWFLDIATGRLHYMPEPGVDPNTLDFVAPVLNRIVNAQGDVTVGTHVQHVHFDGLEFRDTTYTLGHIEARVHTDAVIMFENTNDSSVKNCRFENIGGYALWMHLDSRRNVFDRNTVKHSGGGGVLLTGARLGYMDDAKVYTPGDEAAKVAPILNEITRNTVQHCGKIRYYGGGVHLDSRPFRMSMEPGNYIAHNHFNDLSRNGVFAFRNQGGNVVEYNHIHDAMQTTIDGGCVHFATMNHLNAPNFILNNWLYDIWGYEQNPSGIPNRRLGNGVFLDWDTSNTTVKDNWIYNSVGGAVKVIWNNWNVVNTGNQSSSTPITPPFADQVGPDGTATHGIDLANNRLTGSVIHYTDRDHFSTTGTWTPESAIGMWGLFEFNFMVGTSTAPSEATYTLPIPEDGTYQISLLYKPGKDRASNVPIAIAHADGTAEETWNMRRGSHHGFAVEVGTYRFHAADTNSVTISTAGTDGKVIADGVAFVKVMPGAGNPLPTASGQEPFLPLLPVESGDAPWSAHVVPRSGPQRDGQPTMALRWRVDQQPGPDSPDLLLGWQDVQAVRFWLYVDAPRDEACNVLLTGQRGYFMTSVPLDFSGWRQVTIPIQQFRMVREGTLEEMRRLSFRMQGYGQSSLDEDTIWWIDQIEVQPKPGAELRMTTSLESNRKAWQELADAGNPFFALLTRRFDTELAPFQPPETVPNAWQFRTIAERLVPVAYAAAEGEPPLAGREDLVNHAVETVDWLLDQCSPEGWWWRRGPITGDPNVNRFTLGPLLDAVRLLRKLPAGQAAWPRWRETLERAIELQRRAYRGQEDWDWGGRPAGQYANQDLYYALIMALSAELFERPDDRRLAEDMMQQVAANLLPDGGIRYIGLTNESPVYHALNLVLIGRYLTLTGDETARQLLRGTANYWPLVLTAEGQPESWSDVWWKQTWGYVRPEALVVSAGGTGDPRHQWLLWRVLERTAPADGHWFALCCAPYWTGTDPGEPMPDRFVVPDGNMRGIRGRQGSWYFGVGQGRGLRNTFVGGLITHPSTTRPLQAAFRGAQIDVLPQEIPWRGYGQWLSELDDTAGLALRLDSCAAIGVRYTLQPGRINGWPPPETPASPWQVTQIWRADGSGHVGVVVLEATADAPGATVAGRIALGPQMPELVAPDRWQSGPIGVRRYHGFGTARTGPTPHYNTRPENAWHGVIFEQTLDGGARRGDRFVYAVWVGPHDAAAPQSVELLPDDMGWIAVSAEGRHEAVVFNATEDPRTITLPWSEKSPQAWTGSNGASLTIAQENGHCRITLAPGQCAIVE